MTVLSDARVAVIVVNWNSGSLLKKCITAIHRQTRAPAHITIIDNASGDESLAAIEEDYPDVHIEKLETNAGFAAANNVAARSVADCDWLAFVNPDAFLEREWLEKMLTAAARNPEYAFFGCRLVQSGSPDTLDGTGDVYHVSGLAWRRGYGNPVDTAPTKDQEIFAPCAAAALYRRDVFLAAGGFDEHFFCYFEDVDLGFRLRLAGQRCLYVAGASAQHVGSGTTGKSSDFSVYYGHRNLVWTFVKNMPGLWFWAYLPQHIILNIVSALVYSARGKAKVILRAKRDAILGLAWAWRARRQLQSQQRGEPAILRRVMLKGFFRPYVRRHV